MSGAVKAASVEIPTTGFFVTSPKPRAADKPTRSPVKLPGPMVTAKRSIASNLTPAFFITLSTIGSSCSACPRPISRDSDASTRSSAVSITAAEQASSAVSIARTRIPPLNPALDRANFRHVRHEMPQQILDALLQRRGRRRAAGAGPAHVEEHDAVLVAAEGDVAAVGGDRRPHARLDQLLDRADGFLVLLLEKFVFDIGMRSAVRAGRDGGLVGEKVLHHRAENRRLQVVPLAVLLGHGDEIRAEHYAADLRNREQPLCERRTRGGFGIAHIQRAARENGAARQELQRRGVGRRFGLNEHGEMLPLRAIPGPNDFVAYYLGLSHRFRKG